ncbi:DNA polymerase III subunit chi [Candidatus Cytomitobacter primus]|uniref:DNA polymerase III subunit chi n=1 Tax=Candidatus Cytomitobacter primus TaxID=2066024 RepID=A0A5C0UF49_9PROT|nr:DNA polymerase III subunit chi [Candidatus Cytomitobacter primus]QEK38340.1 hypothetical protein FZC34_00150 [Candidatus Cytomitobacter primus]
MITYFCNIDKSVRNLFELIYKLYKYNKRILLITKNAEDMDILNEAFWKFRKFLPHGDENDKYLNEQPVVLSTQKHNIGNNHHMKNIKFDVHIYFHHANDQYDSVENILWNPPEDKAKGKIWKEENGKWNIA